MEWTEFYFTGKMTVLSLNLVSWSKWNAWFPCICYVRVSKIPIGIPLQIWRKSLTRLCSGDSYLRKPIIIEQWKVQFDTVILNRPLCRSHQGLEYSHDTSVLACWTLCYRLNQVKGEEMIDRITGDLVVLTCDMGGFIDQNGFGRSIRSQSIYSNLMYNRWHSQ